MLDDYDVIICQGMTDIARQTVEFLYEENGGMPRDLHLPTMEDIKDELAKFTIDRLHKGTVVVIKTLSQQTTSSTGTILLPKFAVRSMLKTFGLMGIVLDIDQVRERGKSFAGRLHGGRLHGGGCMGEGCMGVALAFRKSN